MLRNSLPYQFNDDELLLRAVLSRPWFWKDGKLSSAALKTSNGLSVDRTYDRTLEESIAYMLQNLTGSVVTFTLDDCKSVNALVKYRPTHNIYHSEIHGSKDNPRLSSPQAKELALRAVVQYTATIITT